jgi:ADP-heptose:LPS heptosyltransferase
MNEKHGRGFDRVIDLTLAGTQKDILVKEAANKASVRLASYSPQLFLTQAELEEARDTLRTMTGEENKKVVIVNFLTSRVEWQGRSWNVNSAAELINGLNEMGLATVEVGRGIESTGAATISLINKTSLRGLFAVMACADLFIGIDSLTLHVAQAFHIPSYVLFGATEPIARVVDFNETAIIRNNKLACIGCYHKPGAQPINKCRLGNEECMNGISAEDVLNAINGEVDPMTTNIEYLQGVIRH